MRVLLVLLALLTPALAARARPKHPWGKGVVFVRDDDVSDDFGLPELDLSKWDPHGIRNPETGCPKWNGPPSLDNPAYATFFPTLTDPKTGAKDVKLYRVHRRKLFLKVSEKPLDFFTSREYYCNTTTFKCNHDGTTDCFSTNFFGQPDYADKEKTRYKGAIHDKCKKEPFCIPHPEYVTRKPRVYTKYVAPHLVGKTPFKYGFVEVRVRIPDSSAVAAAWMHDDELVNGFCRYRKDTRPDRKSDQVLECPSVIRSRRWQEIDVLEAMNSQIHKRRYIPNIHAFAGYKGEFTSATAVDNGDGSMGGGPILLKKSVFYEKKPGFTNVPESKKVGNDWHYNPGSVTELDADWASKVRTVGMYWSPNEIRFLLDGKEVKRVKNTIIHQPMLMDLSYGLNVGWARETPTKRQLQRSAKFIYVRRWEVYTKGGVEPPSSLPLDDKMEREFKDLYGSELGGVFGEFPVNDDLTVVQTNPEKADVIVPMPGPLQAPTTRFSTASELGGDDTLLANSSLHLGDCMRYGKFRDVARQIDEELLPAGGDGNLRYSRGRRRMTDEERRAAEARPDRVALVPKPGAIGTKVEDPAITVYELTDPNLNAAGWSSRGGKGMGDDVA